LASASIPALGGAILPQTATTTFTVLKAEKRPVSAVAELPDVTLRLLFDGDHNLQERVFKEQFAS
jgi:NAD+ kinase